MVNGSDVLVCFTEGTQRRLLHRTVTAALRETATLEFVMKKMASLDYLENELNKINPICITPVTYATLASYVKGHPQRVIAKQTSLTQPMISKRLRGFSQFMQMSTVPKMMLEDFGLQYGQSKRKNLKPAILSCGSPDDFIKFLDQMRKGIVLPD